jgi:hypothetical protein
MIRRVAAACVLAAVAVGTTAACVTTTPPAVPSTSSATPAASSVVGSAPATTPPAESADTALRAYVGVWDAFGDTVDIRADRTGLLASGDVPVTRTPFTLAWVNGRAVGTIADGPQKGDLFYLTLDGKGHLYVSFDGPTKQGQPYCLPTAPDRTICGGA